MYGKTKATRPPGRGPEPGPRAGAVVRPLKLGVATTAGSVLNLGPAVSVTATTPPGPGEAEPGARRADTGTTTAASVHTTVGDDTNADAVPTA
jgi:hypothetical protein